jgi:hypothetical protein
VEIGGVELSCAPLSRLGNECRRSQAQADSILGDAPGKHKESSNRCNAVRSGWVTLDRGRLNPYVDACPPSPRKRTDRQTSAQVRDVPRKPTHAPQQTPCALGEARLSRRPHPPSSALLVVMSDQVFPRSSC